MAEETRQNQYNNIGFGYVQSRTPVRMNLDAYAKAIDKIDQKDREAREKMSAIDAALAQVELDKSEDKWKYNYAKRIKNKITNASMFGDYSSALNTAIDMAGKAVSSPELLGRVRANKEHQERLKEIKARNDLEDITKERWEKQNEYSYEDSYDEDGNIIGGTGWKEKWSPVKHVNIVQLSQLAGSLTAPEKHSSSSSYNWQNSISNEMGLVNKDGKLQTYNSTPNVPSLLANPNSNEIKSVLQTESSSSNGSSSSEYQRLTYDRIKKTFDALEKAYPGAIDSMLQDYDDYTWKIEELQNQLNNTTDSIKAAGIQSKIDSYKKGMYGNNGQLMSAEEWMLSKVDPILHAQAYNWISTSKSVGGSSSKVFGLDPFTKGISQSGNDLLQQQGKVEVEGGKSNPTNEKPSVPLSPWQTDMNLDY